MALLYIFLCIALCLMIIGLPYAKTLLQHALLCLRPYGSELRSVDCAASTGGPSLTKLTTTLAVPAIW